MASKKIGVEIRRHAFKGSGAQKDVLSQEGYEQARAVGSMDMRDRNFTHIVVSPFFRTAQTAAAMAEGAGDFTAVNMSISPALFTERMDEWKNYFAEHGSTLVPDHPLIVEESQRMRTQLRNFLLFGVKDGDHVLCIGHSPFLECLIFGLTKKAIDPLEECEGVEIKYTRSSCDTREDQDEFTITYPLLL